MRLLLAAVVALAPVAGSAIPAQFDFNDFPDETATTAYGCGGKSYCTAEEVFRAGDIGAFSAISTTRGGITGTFGKPGGGFQIWEPGDADKQLNAGNDSPHFDVFLADFDRDLIRIEIDLTPPRPIFDVFQWTVIELWSGPGATDTLVASALFTNVAPGIDPDSEIVPMQSYSLTAPGRFRSARFGGVLSTDPDCRVDCFHDGYPNWFSADNIRVTPPIPEPSAFAVFALGAVVSGASWWWGSRATAVTAGAGCTAR